MDTFYCSHPFAETWFDWLAKVRFCTVCGCAESENGARFIVSAEFVALRKLCSAFGLRSKTCDGCTALTAFARREVIWPLGMENPDTPDQEFLERGLFGKCDLGFSQKWHDWGFATPLESCPKPIITSKQAGEMYSLISGKKNARNTWYLINDIREIIDILKNLSPEILEVTFIEDQLAGIDAVLRKAIKVMHISPPEGFELKQWHASIGPSNIDE